MNEPERYLAEVERRHRRCFWLDGGGEQPWSRGRSLVGWLDDDDVSLTYSAATGLVTRHRAGGAQVVGDDIFAVLAGELAPGPRTPTGAATSGTPRAPTFPRARTISSPTRCGCAHDTSGSSTTPPARVRPRGPAPGHATPWQRASRTPTGRRSTRSSGACEPGTPTR